MRRRMQQFASVPAEIHAIYHLGDQGLGKWRPLRLANVAGKGYASFHDVCFSGHWLFSGGSCTIRGWDSRPSRHNLRLLLRTDICLAFMQSHTDRTDMTTRRKIIWVGLLICAAIIGSMIDCVKPEGDHITYLVLAPHPTLRFSYSGGEEGSWRHTHPNMKEPWWVAGRYLALMEVGY